MAYIDYNLQFSTENKPIMKDPNYGKSVYDPIEQSTEGVGTAILASIGFTVVAQIVVGLLVGIGCKISDKPYTKQDIENIERKYGLKLKPYIDKYIKHLENITNNINIIYNNSYDKIVSLENVKSVSECKTKMKDFKHLSEKDIAKISTKFIHIIENNYENYVNNFEETGKKFLTYGNELILEEFICTVKFSQKNFYENVYKILKSINPKIEITTYKRGPGDNIEYYAIENCKDINLLKLCETLYSIQ